MIRYDALPKSVAARDRYDPAKRAAQPIRAQGLTGYRHDSQAHEAAREKVDAERRREIASAGGRARAAMYGHTGEASDNYRGQPLPKGLKLPAAARIAAAIARSEKRTPAQVKAAAAARAAASRPARRAAQRAREAAARRKP
jgi:hypothetical protein